MKTCFKEGTPPPYAMWAPHGQVSPFPEKSQTELYGPAVDPTGTASGVYRGGAPSNWEEMPSVFNKICF